MGLNIPQLLAQFTHKDTDTQRLYENTGKAVNPLLGFVTKTFVTLANGALRIIPDVQIANYIATGNATVGGKITGNGGQAIVGASTIQGTQVIQKNADGTGGSQLVQNNQTVNGATSSSTGFKCTYDMGCAWSSSAVVGTRYQTKRYMQNDSAASTFNAPMLFQPVYAGSIIGIHSYSQGTSGGTIQINLYKNQTIVSSGLTPYLTVPAASGGQYSGYPVLYPKGQNAFAPNDFFCASANWSVAGNGLTIITLFVEYNA